MADELENNEQQAQGTAGHESEDITVEVLKSTLQKFKTTHVDTKANASNVYTKAQVDAMRAPRYDPTTKLIVFPSTATFSYNPQTKIITISQ